MSAMVEAMKDIVHGLISAFQSFKEDPVIPVLWLIAFAAWVAVIAGIGR